MLKFLLYGTIQVMSGNGAARKRVCSAAVCCLIVFVATFCCQANAYSSVYNSERVAILPFEDFSGTPGEGKGETVSRIFARQFTEWSGAYVYHPQIVRKTLDLDEDDAKTSSLQERALKLGRALGAQLVIYGAVTEYDGFSPYGFAVSIEVTRVADGERLLSRNFSVRGFSLWEPEPVSFPASLFRKKPVFPRSMNEYIEKVVNELIRAYF